MALELPVPPLGTALTVPPPPNPISPTMVFDPPIPGNAFSNQIGFGAECFYWVGDADFTLANFPPRAGLKIVFRAGLEASFGTGAALNGDQMVFSRIRFNIAQGLTAADAGTYVVHHPYGEETIVFTAADVAKGIRFTRDIGLTPLNFAEALGGDVGPFLVQTAPIARPMYLRVIPYPAGSAMGTHLLRSPAAPLAVTRCPSPRRRGSTWVQAPECRLLLPSLLSPATGIPCPYPRLWP